MKISIITVSHNSVKTIKDTIESVLSQKDCEVEYIIVDGKSNDGTLEMITPYLDRISTLVSEPDNGVYYAMNKGLELCTGEIVGFLNSDDVYENSKVLNTVVESFNRSNCDAVYGDLVYVRQNSVQKVIRTWKSQRYNKRLFQFGWMPPHPTFFVRREFYEKFGYFNTEFRNAADYEIMLRFLYREQITAIYIPEILVRMRVGGMSNASFWNRIKANREDRLAWKINNLTPNIFTLWLKPIRKIPQFISRIAF